MEKTLKIEARKRGVEGEGYRGLDADIVLKYEDKTFVLNGNSSFDNGDAFLEFKLEAEKHPVGGLNYIIADYDYEDDFGYEPISGYDSNRNHHPRWYYGMDRNLKAEITDEAKMYFKRLREEQRIKREEEQKEEDRQVLLPLVN